MGRACEAFQYCFLCVRCCFCDSSIFPLIVHDNVM
jgi:hypothetical protein